MLDRWFYISTSRLDETDAERHVGDIVAISVQRNRSLEVTGALLFTGRHFAQYIEGPPAAIAALQESILQDPRHQDIGTIACGSYPTRHFLTWSLGYAGPSRFVASKIEGALTDALKNRQGGAQALLHMLEQFAFPGSS
ncbi:BLUF domain-containing protein [Sphingobium chungbukense]|uniref:Blue light sensor protein n=1 Tax=Sphingobium chungbukense TaxID=56193 RepID=A0A0M3ALV1_9SPHN|nr:BLUF domain-containing protein [Sphingobium chungbukense]KKW89534.1 blue light sensor protein [Sphingobium chungbukense]